MSFSRVAVAALLVLLAPGLVLAEGRPKEAQQAIQNDPVLSALSAELAHLQEGLGALDPPPFYIALTVTETHSDRATGGFGAITGAGTHVRRFVTVDVRVGSPRVDNTHPVRGPWGRSRSSSGVVPIDNDIPALRRAIWREAEAVYRTGVERLGQVQANVDVKAAEEDQTGDFVASAPIVHLDDVLPPRLLGEETASQLAEWSAPFAVPEWLFTNIVARSATTDTRWFVNTEGSVVRTSDRYDRLQLYAEALADDGMQLPAYRVWFWRAQGDGPEAADVVAAVEDMTSILTAMRDAPVAEPSTVPAILSGSAAGVFFHEVLGHRLEAHRQKDEHEGQTFRNRVGTRVTSPGLSVVFDPTLREFDGEELSGYYSVDDEGVGSRRVVAVDDGILRSFLVGRRPVEGFIGSNGHGRAQAGRQATARQSNMLISVADPVSMKALEAQLIAELVATGKPYGLVFERVRGGFTLTGRTRPNSFEVLPTEVYRLYPDGRRELVRGVDLIGTPLAALQRVVAGADETGVFHGYCGAESGWVPVSAVAPALLLSEIEVQKKPKEQEQAPVLQAPPSKGGAS